MSQAAALLASLADYDSPYSSEDHIVIGNDRFITVPESLKRLAVQYDHDVETVTFDCPRYWDEHDMSQMVVYINYLLPNGEKGQYMAKNVISDGLAMHFDWTISNAVTQYKGKLSFLVCIKKTDDEGNEFTHWNSELNQDCYISEGLECSDIAYDLYPDIVTQLLLRMDEVEAIATPEAMQSYVDTWLQENHDTVLAEIETKAQEALDTIPEDYTATYAMAREGARDKADAIQRWSEGESIVLTDASDNYLRELQVFGKTTQITTTGKQLLNYADHYRSIGATISDDTREITLPKVEPSSENLLIMCGILDAGTYYVSAELGTAKRMRIEVYEHLDDGTNVKFEDSLLQESDVKLTFTLDDAKNVVIKVYTLDATDLTVIAGSFKNLLLTIDEDAAWEPYSGGVASPSPGWPQELTSIETPELWLHNNNLLDLNSATFSKCTLADAESASVRLDFSDYYYGEIHLPYLADYVLANQDKPFTLKVNSNPVGMLSMVIAGTRTIATDGGLTYQELNSYAAATSLTITPTGFTEVTNVTIRLGRKTAAYTDTTTVFTGVCLSLDEDAEFEKSAGLQSLAIPHTLRGISVSQNGNYANVNGQQWVCDEIDFERGVSIQRISEEVALSTFYDVNINNTEYDWVSAYTVKDDRLANGRILCRKLAVENWDLLNKTAELGSDVMAWYANASFGLAIRRDVLGIADGATTGDILLAFADWAVTNDISVIYPLATPIETSLTADEIAAYEALHTNNPNTTVLNDSEAWMELSYNADLKMYVHEYVYDSVDEHITQDRIQLAVDNWLSANFASAEGEEF